MLIKESELRRIISHELFNNEFKINETFYYELNNRLLSESFMQDVKSKVGRLGITGLTFLSLANTALANPTLGSPTREQTREQTSEQIANNAEEMAIIRIMIKHACGRESAKRIYRENMQAFKEGEARTQEDEEIFSALSSSSNTKASEEAVIKANHEMMKTYREQQEEIRNNNQNIENNPFTVLNDPNISHEDSRYVFASVSFNATIDKFLLDSAADLESGNLKNVSDAAERAKKASSLKFSGQFKNAKELQTYLKSGSLTSK